MSENLQHIDPEQLMVGGLLAIIVDKELDFMAGELEDADTEEMISAVMTSLYELGDDAEFVLGDYGVIET